MSDPRFELRQVTENEWLVLDHRFDSHDSHQTVAVVRDQSRGLDVLWMRELPLRAHYRTATDVLDAIQNHYDPPSRSTAPVTIPHVPPFLVSKHRAKER
ncbi:hypothetical protein J7E68_06510 [Microbacterium sp. ISL-103]|uniref:hypothetical protein n=1 Tax=Microbacterium sp. ISL-103 TaxID=2819156 RepID=UPI001BE9C19F|nr:hypothetical protein [Microbacterium sp. ISL-103]MBT2474238.1 hypothetical protein [Microbacterium sp. ISL-103]